MRLYKPEYFFYSCGPTVVAIITGLKLYTIDRRILAMRAQCPGKGPGKYYGHDLKSKCFSNTDETLLSELLKLIRPKVKVGRFIKVQSKKIKRLALCIGKGTYLINFARHVAVLHNGLICDNQGFYQPLDNYRFRFDKIISYAKLGK